MSYVRRITEWPESERPRERLLRLGAESLSDAELLAIILRTGGREGSAIDLARHLLTQAGGFRGLDRMSAEELCRIPNVGTAKAAQIKAALEIGKRFRLEQREEGERVHCSDDVYHLVGPMMRDLPREEFRVLFLTQRNQVIANKVLFEGSLTESIASPREILREALNLSAASLILIHNHPSGDPTPSEEDRRVTQRIRAACETMGVQLLDHIIVGRNSYFSFADRALL
ncbi:MAG: DNA repair protein RadC [candidate division KSB1 bacterium]|nr:DNA repair protein RadC [candidate division KSB1 bacterium]